MKLATLKTTSGLRPAVLDGDQWRLVDAPDVISILTTRQADLKMADAAPVPAARAELAAPIPEPGKIFCVGMNFHSHAVELGMPIPKYPNLWAKFSSSMIGPHDDIQLPFESETGDYEVELVIIIGRSVRRATEEQAAKAIAGFCVGNDSSVREWQARTREIMQGKAWEGMTPTGPCITTIDESGDARDLQMRTFVNGELRQDCSTSDMIFSPAWLVAYISTFITLSPGDIILTGTPSGVGFTKKPPMYLKAGDIVRCEIEGLGQIDNLCVVNKEAT